MTSKHLPGLSSVLTIGLIVVVLAGLTVYAVSRKDGRATAPESTPTPTASATPSSTPTPAPEETTAASIDFDAEINDLDANLQGTSEQDFSSDEVSDSSLGL